MVSYFSKKVDLETRLRSNAIINLVGLISNRDGSELMIEDVPAPEKLLKKYYKDNEQRRNNFNISNAFYYYHLGYELPLLSGNDLFMVIDLF